MTGSLSLIAWIIMPLASYGVDGMTPFSPGMWGEQGGRALGVLGRGPQPRAVHGADHDGGDRLAAEHVPELRGLVVDLVEADAHEIDEHQLGDRAHPGRGRADRGADERRLRDGGVEDPAGELVVQPLGHAQYAAPGVVVTGCP